MVYLKEEVKIMKLKALDQRHAGILLPLFSLPGKHGIGDLGKEAYEFVDLSAQAGFSIWQILPLNPSSSGNSPYTPYSLLLVMKYIFL